MTDYPEALIEKVAAALAKKPLVDPENDSEWYMREWFSEADIREFAVAALDALGLREEVSGLYVNLHGRTAVRDRARHRYVTDWEENPLPENNN